MPKDDGAQIVTDEASNVVLQDIPLPGGGFQYIDNDTKNKEPWTSRVSTVSEAGKILATTYTVTVLDSGTIEGSDAIDTVESTKTCVLGADVENLKMVGWAGVLGTGNGLDNVITGSQANNQLWGLAGNDTITGGPGNDTVDGGTGNDVYVLSGSRGDYSFESIDAAKTRITDKRSVGDGIDVISDVEYVRFSDGTMLLSELLATRR
jgi:Ca2+-binding RTX toxin-like protein